MKKLSFLAIALLIAGTSSFGQQINYYAQADKYAPGYYSTTEWGAGGYYTVDEQNRSMNEAIAAKRREDANEYRQARHQEDYTGTSQHFVIRDYEYSTAWATNGFTTIDEQNRLMNEAVAAKRREEARENGTSYQQEKASRKQDQKVVANKKIADSRKRSNKERY